MFHGYKVFEIHITFPYILETFKYVLVHITVIHWNELKNRAIVNHAIIGCPYFSK